MIRKITHFSKKELRLLFLVCVFPIHLWAIIIIFRDLEYILFKTDLWYVAGYSGYILAFALIESCLYFIFMFLLGHLFPKKLKQNGKAFTITCALALIFSFWATGDQVFYMLVKSPPAFFSWIMLRIPYHQTLAFSFLIFMIIVSFIAPIWIIIKSSNGQNTANLVIERISLLSIFYLMIDFLPIMAAVIRYIG